MSDFLEFDIDTKTLKSINLDDFSVEDLNEYMDELTKEMSRVKKEIHKKNELKTDAEKFFK